MPFKKRLFKRKRPVRRAKGRKRLQHHKSTELVIYNNPRAIPFPSRYRCRLETNIYGYIPASTSPGLAGVTYTCLLNQAFTPYNSTSLFPNSAPSVGTVQPTGYSSLANANLYQKIRVLSSRIKVEFLPESLLDTIQVVVVPSVGAPGRNVSDWLNQPFAKSGLMSASKDDHNSRRGGSELVHSMTQHKLLGVAPRAIMDDLSNNYTHGYTATVPTKMYWQVGWTTPDLGATTANIKYRIILEHYVEMYDPFIGVTLDT